MIGPDHIECRDGYHQRAAGFEQRFATAKRGAGIRDMFENIQKQNKRVLFAGTKGIVEWTDMNFLKLRIRGINNFTGGLYTLDVAEYHQPIEQQPVTAPHVQDRAQSVCRTIRTQDLQPPAHAHAKLPMILEKFPIVAAIVRTHALYGPIPVRT